MSDFLRSSMGSTEPSDMNTRKEAMMNSVRTQLALANMQELMDKSIGQCYTKCVTKPGSSLSSSEQTCLSRCLDRYLEAFTLVNKTYIARISKERFEGQM